MSQPPPQTPSILRTARLDLIAATVELVQAEMEADLERFAAMLGVAVPAAWPPPLNDRDSQQWMLDMLQTSPSQWGLYYCVLRDGRELVGNAGFKGAPVKGGVEIGYSILEAHQRRGYATEAARALVAYAFEQPEVQQVVAETLPDLVPSIGVMAKCGMVFIGEGNPEGELRTVRYAVRRE